MNQKHEPSDGPNPISTTGVPISQRQTSLLGQATEVFTGVRSTGDLTVGNYLGAVKPILELTKSGMRPMVFVADIHALTDREPSEAYKYRYDLARDYIALGLNPKACDLFLQSSIIKEVAQLTLFLFRHVSVAELTRLPTLKEKLRASESPENANALLAAYPVMMASDILLQRPRFVPVGQDQLPHMEIMRKMAARFNRAYGNVLPVPEPLEVAPLRIMGLKGSGKMSKTNPEEALFLSDPPELAARKIKKAQTAIAGEMNPALESNITIARGLASSQAEVAEIDAIIHRHLTGANCMGEFKNVMSRIVIEFLADFQRKREELDKNPDIIQSSLENGRIVANRNAEETLSYVERALAGEFV